MGKDSRPLPGLTLGLQACRDTNTCRLQVLRHILRSGQAGNQPRGEIRLATGSRRDHLTTNSGFSLALLPGPVISLQSENIGTRRAIRVNTP